MASGCTCAATGATKRWWRAAIGARARALARGRHRPGARAGSTSCSPRTARPTTPDWQKLACAVALRGSVAIITGGPGTGKTYTVARLLALLFAMAPDGAEPRIALAAPTGKAAARLKQSIDKALTELADKVGDKLPLRELTARMGAARTLHSLLGARPDTRAFAHNQGNPLDVDVLIVDEASMVHLEMMASLLDALPPAPRWSCWATRTSWRRWRRARCWATCATTPRPAATTPPRWRTRWQAGGETIPAEFLGSAGALAQQTVMLRHSRRFGGPIGQLALAVNAGDVARAEAGAARRRRRRALDRARAAAARAAAGDRRLPALPGADQDRRCGQPRRLGQVGAAKLRVVPAAVRGARRRVGRRWPERGDRAAARRRRA